MRRVSIERQREISATTLGRLHELARLIAEDHIAGAAEKLALLRETFPTWGLLIEVEAYLDLQRHRADQGLARIESLVKGGGELHLSPVVGAACCLQLEGLDSALELLARIERRGDSERHPLLRRALAISAGHLPALLASRDYLPETAPVAVARTRSVTQRLMGEGVEWQREPVRDLGLDLNPEKLPQTAPAMKALEHWEDGGSLDDFRDMPALFGLLQLLLGPGRQRPATLLQPHAAECGDPLTLESFGFASFACGEPRTALRFFETAIHLAPAAGRAHWGRAIACHRVGWKDAASASLRRAKTLADDEPLLSLTERVFGDPQAKIDAAEAERIYPRGFDDMDRFELALLGIEIVPPDDSGIHGEFAAAIVSRALIAGSTELGMAA